MADIADTLGDLYNDAPEAGVIEQEAAPAVTQEPEPSPTPAPAAESPTRDEIPKAVALQWLNEKKEAERELAELRRKPAEPAPDFYDDPEGTLNARDQRLADQQFGIVQTMSRRFAEQTHGADTVKAALAWADQNKGNDPTFYQSYRSSADPVAYVVQQHKLGQVFEKLGQDPDAILRRLAELDSGPGQQPAAQAVPPQSPPAPAAPRSLSAAPGSGGVGTVPPGSEWGSMKFALDT